MARIHGDQDQRWPTSEAKRARSPSGASRHLRHSPGLQAGDIDVAFSQNLLRRRRRRCCGIGAAAEALLIEGVLLAVRLRRRTAARADGTPIAAFEDAG